MKIDPYKNKERWLKWKEKCKEGIPKLSKANSEVILRYLEDMEHGINISVTNIKGSRSYTRLNSLKERICFLAKFFNEKYNQDDIRDINELQLCRFFSEMRNGVIKRKDGERYKSVADYVKIFKAFWHWHQKTNSKQGIEIKDITTDLDTRYEKPRWVYLTEKQVKELSDNASYDYKVLIMFLFDSGIRSPSELINIRVSDLYNECKELHIRDEISKTFGRRIKLMICSELIRDYVIKKELKPQDQVFPIKPYVVNRYLKRIALNLFGEKVSLAGEKYSEITMYDFRHISCCYWLPRYKSESALKFRFGWKKSDKIHYYSELLGMRDTISEEDMLIDITKTEIEKRLTQSENEKTLLQERVKVLEDQMQKFLQVVDKSINIGKEVLVVGEN